MGGFLIKKGDCSIEELSKVAFFQLIRISLGETLKDFPKLAAAQWREVYRIAQEQALLGVLSVAIDQLPEDRRPPREILFKWLVATEQIRQRNIVLEKTVTKVASQFEADGYDSCILKGQGLAQLYPDPELRTAGDIDIWIRGSRKEIVSLVRRLAGKTHVVYHHVDGLKMDGVAVEVHFTPSYMSNPFANRRLQHWIDTEAPKQFGHEVLLANGHRMHSPTLSFNRVFILHHIYRHFFYEGIGLRQLQDFYYVIKQGFTEEERIETLRVYRQLNLLKFAGAVVYVLREVFGLAEQYFVVPPDEKYGKILLAEILVEGNFGQAFQTGQTSETKSQRGLRIIRRSLRFVKYAPEEVLWLPYFKLVNNICYVRQ